MSDKNILKIFVKKNTGKLELYDPKKIENTCIKAGASKKEAEEIIKEIEKILYNEITTKEIYNEVLRFLDAKNAIAGIKYRLKEAIMKLGPEGFAFETFFSKLLNELGYKTTLRKIVKGLCVAHEIDIIAEKPIEKQKVMVECKYHNSPGIYTGLKEILYTYARFLDLRDGWEKGLCEKFDEAWLITNTKFSEEAKEYAKCKGIKIIGWSYPPNQGIEKLIENNKGLYPITILRKVKEEDLKKFSSANLIVINDILTKTEGELAKTAEISLEEALEIKKEAKLLISNKLIS
ncbi:MAG: restriction endonuclease [Candidatus Bathyarchaeia archaeon]